MNEAKPNISPGEGPEDRGEEGRNKVKETSSSLSRNDFGLWMGGKLATEDNKTI